MFAASNKQSAIRRKQTKRSILHCFQSFGWLLYRTTQESHGPTGPVEPVACRSADCSRRQRASPSEKSEFAAARPARHPSGFRQSIGWLLAIGCRLLSVVCFLIGLPALVLACPLCKDALIDAAQTGAQARMVRGLAMTTGALIIVPLLLVGGIAGRLMWSARRASRRS